MNTSTKHISKQEDPFAYISKYIEDEPVEQAAPAELPTAMWVQRCVKELVRLLDAKPTSRMMEHFKMRMITLNADKVDARTAAKIIVHEYRIKSDADRTLSRLMRENEQLKTQLRGIGLSAPDPRAPNRATPPVIRRAPALGKTLDEVMRAATDDSEIDDVDRQ